MTKSFTFTSFVTMLLCDCLDAQIKCECFFYYISPMFDNVFIHLSVCTH
jgi:hypothetical protein